MKTMLVAMVLVAGCGGRALSNVQMESQQHCCETSDGMQCVTAPSAPSEGPSCGALCEPCGAASECCEGLVCNKRGFCAVPTT
jgi:hypothetical protein